jgi:hypothetical protein
MEDDPISKNASLSLEEEKAKAAILAECDNLAAAGVTFVAVHFDGYGDREQLKRWSAMRASGIAGKSIHRLSTTLRTYKTASRLWFRSDTKRTAAALETSFLMAARKITVERNDRFEDYKTTTYEV